MSPDEQPSPPDASIEMGGTRFDVRRPMTGGILALSPEKLKDATELIAMIVNSADHGALAISPMRDIRTGLMYAGIVLIHPEDVADATLTGAGRKMPVALLLTQDIQQFIKPMKPGEKVP